MGEDELLLAAAEDPAVAAGRPGALATVVAVQGSAYRREGARMLVRADGSRVGGVSGGCLEAEVAAQALEAAEEGLARLLRFDTSDPDDAVFGYGSGCAGIIEVLVEPLTAGDAQLALAALASARTAREPTVVLTACSGPLVGARARWEAGAWHGRLAARLADLTVAEVRHGAARSSSPRAGLLDPGAIPGAPRVVWELIEPPLRLVHVGADAGAPEISGAARALGWDVSVLDFRPALLEASRHAPGVELIQCEGAAINSHLRADQRTAVVVASRHWLYDLAALAALEQETATRKLAYLGLIGSQARVSALMGDRTLRAGAVRAPAGHEVGATTPAEIAAGVVAEILSVRPRTPWWPRVAQVREAGVLSRA